jgi:aldose 1-epimerase
VLWKGRRFKHHDGDAVELTYTSKDGEEGYPGTVKASITYILQPTGALKVVFEATTDKTSPINMAQHSYFNLGGHSSGDILNHRLHIHGEHITPTDDNQIPTGEFEAVQDSPFDFTVSRRIGNRIDEVEGGYDHNYVLFGMGRNAKFITDVGTVAGGPKLAAQLEEPKSGRVLKVLTNAPGLQIYTGNYIEGVKGKGGAVYEKHAGLCLETQGFPNAVNETAFPSVLLRPDEVYHHEVIYQFSIR